MEVDGGDSGGSNVPPLENTAFFAIDRDDGYVRIDQSLGNQVLYTPEEARDVARAILAAADEAADEATERTVGDE